MNLNKITYGWLILIGCALIQAVPFNIAMNIQPQFMQYVIEAKKFSIEQFSLIFAIASIVGAFASPFIGKLFTKFKSKILFLMGAIITGGGFMGFAFADSIYEFYFMGAFTQIGVTILSSIGVPLIVSRWFCPEIKGSMLGYVFAGGALGNMVLQQLVANDLMKFGSAESYFILGGICLFVSLIIALFIIKDPKDKNDIIQGKNSALSPKPEVEYTLAEAKNISYFWILSIGFVFLGFYISTLIIQYPHYLESFGMNPKLVGTVASTVALFSFIGNIVGGKLFDKLGVARCIGFAGVFSFLGAVLLFLAQFQPLLTFGFAIFTGLAVFSYIMGIAYMTGSFFGNKEYGVILGSLNFMFAIGHVFGSAFSGLFIEKTSYSIVWMVLIFVVGFSYLLLYRAARGIESLNETKLLN